MRREASRARSVYHEFAPPVELRAVVVCTWDGVAGWARPLRVLPDACGDLVWDGERVVFVGPQPGPSRYQLADETCNVGLRLRPGAGGGILGCAVNELSPEGTRLGKICPREGHRLEAALRICTSATEQRATLESFIALRLAHGYRPERHVLGACRGLEAGRTVAEVASSVGMSPRELRRRFHVHLGYGPKAFARVARFHRFAQASRAKNGASLSLSALAAALGYADQAHLSRECRRLGASTPAALATPRVAR